MISLQQHEMYEEAQRIRRSLNLSIQVLDVENCRIAQSWAESMARNDRMVHGGGEEVIAYYSLKNADPKFGIKLWHESKQGHNEWLLGPYTKVGFGYAVSNSGTYYAGDTGFIYPLPPLPRPPIRFNWLEFLQALFGRRLRYPQQ